MLKTLELKDRTETKKAPSLENGVEAQSLNGQAPIVYCRKHGLASSFYGECELCIDEGWQDFDATRVARLLIPTWLGLDVTERQVIVAEVKDAVGAVEAIGRYKNAEALVLVKWGNVVTVLDHGRIGPSYAVADGAEQRGPLP